MGTLSACCFAGGGNVKLFREYMERNLRPDPVPDALWELPASKARQ